MSSTTLGNNRREFSTAAFFKLGFCTLQARSLENRMLEIMKMSCFSGTMGSFHFFFSLYVSLFFFILFFTFFFTFFFTLFFTFFFHFFFHFFFTFFLLFYHFLWRTVSIDGYCTTRVILLHQKLLPRIPRFRADASEYASGRCSCCRGAFGDWTVYLYGLAGGCERR